MEIRNRWTGEVLATVAGDTLTRANLVAYCRPMVRCRACAADATKHEARA